MEEIPFGFARRRLSTVVQDRTGETQMVTKGAVEEMLSICSFAECDMVLIGYLAFLDPPKESTADAIRALKRHGVTAKILTGDNDKVTRTICKQVGLKVRNMLLGSDLDAMSDDELAKAAESADVFAKRTPDQKARVVSILRESGHTVGFMGGGINDDAAMRAARPTPT